MISKALFFVLVLSVAFIIGFVTAWLYFKRKWKKPLGILQGEMINKKAGIKKLEIERDGLKRKLEEKTKTLEQMKQESATFLENKTSSNGNYDFEIKYQKVLQDHSAMLVKIEELQKALYDCRETQANALMFTDGNPDEKDDLKLINGIGPFIEKKLNNLGIYHFRQISNFNPILIGKVTQAIEFFPGRIERDNWVGQAKELDTEKAKL